MGNLGTFGILELSQMRKGEWAGKGEEVREKEIEKKLQEEVKKRGGIAPKWVSPGMSGVPDRLIFLPRGKFAMAELKAPGEKPRQLQVSRHRLLRRLGFKVYVIDRKEDIEEVLDEIEGKKKEGGINTNEV